MKRVKISDSFKALHLLYFGAVATKTFNRVCTWCLKYLNLAFL